MQLQSSFDFPIFEPLNPLNFQLLVIPRLLGGGRRCHNRHGPAVILLLKTNTTRALSVTGRQSTLQWTVNCNELKPQIRPGSGVTLQVSSCSRTQLAALNHSYSLLPLWLHKRQSLDCTIPLWILRIVNLFVKLTAALFYLKTSL